MAGPTVLASCSLPWTADDGGSDDLAPALGPAETLEALRADAEAVDPEVRRTAPALVDALEGRVRLASGATEGCEGGSFDGATAAGYLVRGRLDAAPQVTNPDAVTRLSTALAEQGWDVSEPNTSTPDRTVVGGRRDGVELSVTVSDAIEPILFSAAGPCRTVDDESRDDAIGLLSREVPPRR